MDDAARALGYLHASERMFQMDILRRVGQGRMAEIRGADLLPVDKFIRTLGFYREAETSFSALSPWAQKRLEAYAEGVNAFLASHALPPEFLLAGDRPEPWKPADWLVIGKIEAYQLSQNFKLKLLRARLTAKLGEERANWLFPPARPGGPITTLPAISDTHASNDSIDDELGTLTGMAKAHRTNGRRRIADPDRKTVLANEPHLDLSAPILWYLARVVTPKGQLKALLCPARRSSCSARTIRSRGADDRGFKRSRPLHRDPRSDGPVEISEARRTEAIPDADGNIRVKGGPDVQLTVRATRHGPLLSDVNVDLANFAGRKRRSPSPLPGLAIATRRAKP